jgi:uncharacterized membrane protein YraQ (UPF0718 family)
MVSIHTSPFRNHSCGNHASAIKQDPSYAAATIGASIVIAGLIAVCIGELTDKQVEEAKTTALVQQLGLQDLERHQRILSDEDRFTTSKDGKYVSGSLTYAGNDRYVISWTESSDPSS